MKKIFLIIFFLLLYLTYAQAEIINEIKIKGNKRVSDDTIILFSNVNVNDNINSNQINEILKELYSTNFFNDVQVSFDKGKLIILVLKVGHRKNIYKD